MTEMVIIYSTFIIHANNRIPLSEILNYQILKYQGRKQTKFKYRNLKYKIRVHDNIKKDVVYLYTCDTRTHARMHARTHSGILLNPKKEWNFAICNNVASPGEYASVKEVRERQIAYDFTYVWNPENKWTNITES